MDSKLKCKVIFCDQVCNEQNSMGQGNIIKNVFPQLEPVNIPGNYTFTAACNITGVSEDKLSKNLKVEFVDPYGKDIGGSDRISIKTMVPEADLFPISIMASFEFRNIVLLYEGEYSFNVYFDDDCIQTETIDVRKSGSYGNML